MVCKVHDVVTDTLKMFNNCEFLLSSMSYMCELKHNLLFISMFNDLGYCKRVEHEVLKTSNGGLNMKKWYKKCKLGILDDSNIIGHASLTSEYF